MEYTNNGNLPRSLFHALTNHPYKYEENCISVTRLVDSPRIHILSARHDHEITRDASENIYSLLGNSVHRTLSGYEHGVAEQRYYAPVGIVQVSGQPDLIEDKTMYDYKVVSTWVHIFGLKDEWIRQMNVYRWLLRRNDVVVNQLSLVAIFRDWKKSQITRQEGYPPFPSQTYNVPVWTLDETDAYVRERLALHVKAIQQPDDLLPLCSPEEMWQREAVYAVHYGEQKRAKKLCDSQEEAESWIAMQKPGRKSYNIIRRHQKRTRCEEYCDANRHCNQYRAFLQDGDGPIGTHSRVPGH